MSKKVFAGLPIALILFFLLTGCQQSTDSNSNDNPTVYTVTFDANGGTGNSVSETFTYGESQALYTVTSLGFTAPYGYTFAGWSKTPAGGVNYVDGANVSNLTKGDLITLYAVWSARTHWQVTFDSNGGDTVDTQVIFDGEFAVEPNPAPINYGYDFVGWYADSALTVPFVFSTAAITKDVTLYAKWTPITYTIHFISNFPADAVNPQGSMPDKTYTFGIAGQLPKNTFSCDNYHFYYWSTDSYGVSMAYQDEQNIINFSSINEIRYLYVYWIVNN